MTLMRCARLHGGCAIHPKNGCFRAHPKHFFKKDLQTASDCDIIAVAQGYSSAGRVLVSKTKGRGFESFCPCQEKRHHAKRGAFFLVGGQGRVRMRALASCIQTSRDIAMYALFTKHRSLSHSLPFRGRCPRNSGYSRHRRALSKNELLSTR